MALGNQSLTKGGERPICRFQLASKTSVTPVRQLVLGVGHTSLNVASVAAPRLCTPLLMYKVPSGTSNAVGYPEDRHAPVWLTYSLTSTVPPGEKEILGGGVDNHVLGHLL